MHGLFFLFFFSLSPYTFVRLKFNLINGRKKNNDRFGWNVSVEHTGGIFRLRNTENGENRKANIVNDIFYCSPCFPIFFFLFIMDRWNSFSHSMGLFFAKHFLFLSETSNFGQTRRLFSKKMLLNYGGELVEHQRFFNNEQEERFLREAGVWKRARIYGTKSGCGIRHF